MNKKAQALGILGIIAVILVIEGVFIFLTGLIGGEIQSRNFAFNSDNSNNCDCGTITCDEYSLIYGTDKLIELCTAQGAINTTFSNKIITGFSEVPIISIIFGVINIIMIIAIVIIFRGGHG